MLDEVFRQRLGVGDELVGDHVGGLPAALLEGVLGRRRPHGGVPHRERELLVAERPGAVERVRGAERQPDEPGGLRLAARRPAEVEVAGREDQVGPLVDQLDRRVADGDRVGLAVDVDELDRPPEQPARVVQRLDRHLRAAEPGRVERRLNAGQAERPAEHDRVFLGRRRHCRQHGRKHGGDRRLRNVHLLPPVGLCVHPCENTSGSGVIINFESGVSRRIGRRGQRAASSRPSRLAISLRLWAR